MVNNCDNTSCKSYFFSVFSGRQGSLCWPWRHATAHDAGEAFSTSCVYGKKKKKSPSSLPPPPSVFSPQIKEVQCQVTSHDVGVSARTHGRMDEGRPSPCWLLQHRRRCSHCFQSPVVWFSFIETMWLHAVFAAADTSLSQVMNDGRRRAAPANPNTALRSPGA